jgi:hypothetical protein
MVMSPVRPSPPPASAERRDDVLGRADREARVREVDIFAPDAEPAAEFARAAGILDQLEFQHARREFAFDDLDRGDLGIALIDGGAGSAVLARAPTRPATDDLVLHIGLAGLTWNDRR